MYLCGGLLEFWREADPVPKLGIRYVNWGRRPYFDYTFGFQFNYQFLALPREVGYYCDEEVTDAAAAQPIRAFRTGPPTPGSHTAR